MPLAIQEISRKLLHLVALLMPVGILYFPRLAPFVLGIGFLAVSLMEWARFRHPQAQILFQRLFGIMLRREESRLITGATWIILSSFLCALIFPHVPQVPFMALSMFILGDSAAAIAGQTIGKVKIGRKTLEGSLACLAMCLFLGYMIFPYVPGMDDKLLRPSVIWTSALVITFFELIPLRVKNHKINDNLSVPLIASFVIYGWRAG